MSDRFSGILADRGVIAVKGPDAETFLNGLITNDVEKIAPAAGNAIHAALLTPQGKILFEFFVSRPGDGDAGEEDSGGGFVIDVAQAQAGDLIKRLSMYKLRAKVELSDISETHAVFWADSASDGGDTSVACLVPDARDSRLGMRGIVPRQGRSAVDAVRFDDLRVDYGVAETGADFAPGTTFPHDVNFDLIGSVDFKKGCFIGQEVVSRTQHKAVPRKRAATITSIDAPLTAGEAVTAGAAQIGTVGKVRSDGMAAIGLLRIDRVIEALDKSEMLKAGDATVSVDADVVASYRAAAARAG